MKDIAALIDICRRLPRPVWGAVLTYLIEYSSADGIVPGSIRQLNNVWESEEPSYRRRPIDVSPAAVRRSVRALENLRLLRVLEGVDATSSGFAIRLNALDATFARELGAALARLGGEDASVVAALAHALERRVAPAEFWTGLAARFHGETLDARALLAPTFAGAPDAGALDVTKVAADFAVATFGHLPVLPVRIPSVRDRSGRLRWVRRAVRPRERLRLGPSLLVPRLAEWTCWPDIRPWMEKLHGEACVRVRPDGKVDEDQSTSAALATLAILQRAAPEGRGDGAVRAVVAVQAWFLFCRIRRLDVREWGPREIRSLIWRMTRPGPDRLPVDHVLPRLAGYFWIVQLRRRRGLHQFVPLRWWDQILGPFGARWRHEWNWDRDAIRARDRGDAPTEPGRFLETADVWPALQTAAEADSATR